MSRRRPRGTIEFWPGFVDALASLLIVIIFLVLIFVLAQFFLGQALSGKDAALRKLDRQIAQLADVLALEPAATSETQLSAIGAALQATLAARDDALGKLSGLQDRLALLDQGIARRDIQIGALQAQGDIAQTQLAEAAKQTAQLTLEAQQRVDLLNQQIAALRTQLGQLADALGVARVAAQDRDTQIAELGQKLNLALANRVEELARYRSEFFGRLRAVLGTQPGIRIVGDRLVFQAEILFDPGSAELGRRGRDEIAGVAKSLRELAPRIPRDLAWVMQVDGHTDSVPIHNRSFASNWELSTARALAVVHFLAEQGIAPEHLAAAGYGSFQPLERGGDAAARQRNRRIELKLTQR